MGPVSDRAIACETLFCLLPWFFGPVLPLPIRFFIQGTQLANSGARRFFAMPVRAPYRVRTAKDNEPVRKYNQMES